jgi:hypothetical protein
MEDALRVICGLCEVIYDANISAAFYGSGSHCTVKEIYTHSL